MNIIQQLARAAMESVGDDLPAAKAFALSQARQQPEVQDALIAFAVDTIIDSEWRSGRSLRWNQAQVEMDEPSYNRASTPSDALMSGIRIAVDDAKRRLMDWEMPGGKRLGDSVRSDLLQSAGLLTKQADTMKTRSAWLSAVAAMLPDNQQPVRKVLREADLQRAMKRVTRKQEAA